MNEEHDNLYDGPSATQHHLDSRQSQSPLTPALSITPSITSPHHNQTCLGMKGLGGGTDCTSCQIVRSFVNGILTALGAFRPVSQRLLDHSRVKYVINMYGEDQMVDDEEPWSESPVLSIQALQSIDDGLWAPSLCTAKAVVSELLLTNWAPYIRSRPENPYMNISECNTIYGDFTDLMQSLDRYRELFVQGPSGDIQVVRELSTTAYSMMPKALDVRRSLEYLTLVGHNFDHRENAEFEDSSENIEERGGLNLRHVHFLACLD